MDPHSRFELESELESLRKEISDLKTSIIKNLNENLLKELALLEASRILQLKKLIYAYSKGAHLGLLKVEEAQKEPENLKPLLVELQDIKKSSASQSSGGSNNYSRSRKNSDMNDGYSSRKTSFSNK